MPRTETIIYQEKEGDVPLLKWMDDLPPKVQDKLIDKVELLQKVGFSLRRPHCDILRDEIYELRAKRQKVNYRILYSFVGQNIVLLSHGCTKEDEVPDIEIERAIRNKKNYINDPEKHTYEEGL